MKTTHDRRGGSRSPRPVSNALRVAFAAAAALAIPCLAQTGGGQEAAILGEDTVWEGTVEVDTLISVQSGATLLVMPGTTVRFGPPAVTAGQTAKTGLVVLGTLVAQGTPAQPIRFTSAAASPAPGDWKGIVFDRARARPSRLKNCTVEFAEEGLRGAASLVTAEQTTLRRNLVGVGAGRELAIGLLDSDIVENETGIACNQGSGLQLEGSRVAGNRKAGVVCLSGSSPRISGSVITGNGDVGISCVQGSSPLIEGNVIGGHERGISMELKSRPQIVRNDIVDNGTGVWAEKLVFPLIADNLIARNGQGIYCNYSAYPEIHGNAIIDNTRFGLVLGDNQSILVEKLIPYRDQGEDFRSARESEFLPPRTRKFTPFTGSQEGLVDARGNWWGAAATAEMSAAGEAGNISAIEDVHDKPDTFYLGAPYPRDRAIYAPWEAAPPATAGRNEQKLGGISGKVVSGGQPAPGVRVYVFPDAHSAFAGEGLVFSGPAQPDGAFALPLAPGSWYLVAKKASPPFPHREPAEGDLFGYYGGNPVTLGEGERREINLQAVRRMGIQAAPSGAPERSVLKGTVLGPQGPVEGASLFVYPDASRNFRGPDLFGPQGAVPGGTDAAGRFEADIPPGRYFVVAARHAGGETLGPLKAGDLHGWFEGNPVDLAAGTALTIAVQVVEKLKDHERKGGGGSGIGIGGTIRDPAGAVPAGIYAYASTDPNLMIGAMPPYRSATVGPDGSYFLDLPGGGAYYVGARSGFGGPPLPGQWHGFFGTTRPAAVPVGANAVVKGIDITVRRME